MLITEILYLMLITEIEGMSGSGSGDNGGGFGSGSGSGFITEENEKGIVDIDNPPYVAVKPEKPDIKKPGQPTGEKPGRSGSQPPPTTGGKPGSAALHSVSFMLVVCSLVAGTLAHRIPLF